MAKVVELTRAFDDLEATGTEIGSKTDFMSSILPSIHPSWPHFVPVPSLATEGRIGMETYPNEAVTALAVGACLKMGLRETFSRPSRWDEADSFDV